MTTVVDNRRDEHLMVTSWQHLLGGKDFGICDCEALGPAAAAVAAVSPLLDGFTPVCFGGLALLPSAAAANTQKRRGG